MQENSEKMKDRGKEDKLIRQEEICVTKKPKIAMGFKRDGECGGPYVCHKRIMESELQKKYKFEALYFPEGRMGIFCPKLVKEVRNQIREINPDIIQIPGLQLLGFHMMVAAVLEKKKTVLVIHGSSTEAIELSIIKKYIVAVLENITLKWATRVYAVSRYVEGWKIVEKHKKKCYGTIYNLPQTEKCAKNNLREELGIAQDDVVIVSTGRITREKGYENLLEVIVQMDIQSNVKVILAGDGDYLNEMQRKVCEKGLEKSVFFLGYRKDISNVLEAGDIFIILTLHETLCMSILEACQHSLPCVATNVGGIPEIINDRENGLLVKPYDNMAAVRALKLLISDRQLRLDMGKRAKENIEKVFSEKKIIQQLDELYKELIEC